MAHAKTLILFWLGLALAVSAPAANRHSHKHPASSAAFDYYLLTLSWSPEYCHGHPDDAQCTAGKHFAFVVHGLWPEYKTGGGPQNCGNQPGLQNPSEMLDIMPDLSLIQHEWITHGTCSGLSAEAYFKLIRQAFSATKIPPQLTQPAAQLTLAPLQIKQAFAQSNPNLQSADLMIDCRSNYLQAVEICLSKDLSPMPCPAPRDCRANTIRVPPVH